jgi:hypothetical protein
VAAFIVGVWIDPAVYASMGLDPKRARRVTRNNPHHDETIRWMGEKIMAFLDAQGMVTTTTRPSIAQLTCCDVYWRTCRLHAPPGASPS